MSPSSPLARGSIGAPGARGAAEPSWRLLAVDRERRDRIARELACSPITAALLLLRGISEPEEAARFLEPRLQDLHDPSLLPDMEPAAERIERAVREGESIAICGDYDADGLSATALLVQFFRRVGHPVRTHIPRRLEEGYGLSLEAVERLAAEGTKLLVTVDNGSTAVEEITRARALGLEVVVTDHHQPGAELPPALALVNPWAAGSRYPYPHLAGVGVVFKLVWQVCRKLSRSQKLTEEFRRFMLDSLALTALGTISDVVPLTGENRILARHGLRALERSAQPGLRRLVEYARRGRDEPLGAMQVSFRIAPAINAAGRLGNAETALRLLTTDSDEEARSLVTLLDRENQKRKGIEAGILESVRARVAAEVDLARDRAIVLADEAWHPGVIGIVASRVVEEFGRPALLIALSGDRGRGSARSIRGVDLHQALSRCQEHLLSFGGHAHAAGVEVARAAVDGLRAALQGAIALTPEEMAPELLIEAEISWSDLSPSLLRELEQLEPHGNGNREPLLSVQDLHLAGAPRLMGEANNHLSFFVRPPGDASQAGTALKAVAFGRSDLSAPLARSSGRLDLAFNPMVNRWGGTERIELRVKSVRMRD